MSRCNYNHLDQMGPKHHLKEVKISCSPTFQILLKQLSWCRFYLVVNSIVAFVLSDAEPFLATFLHYLHKLESHRRLYQTI
uniref:Uncharacterized protein n=1 Tax=Manihot esculenta TaxID=3983 RepID=A0A2C9V585_MANES